MVPAAHDSSRAVLWSGMLRQCKDCFFVQALVLKGGFAFDLRPLRKVVLEHVADLRRCVSTIDESEFAAGFKATRDEIEKASNELEEAVRLDASAHLKKPNDA